jgi:hypothetical protein
MFFSAGLIRFLPQSLCILPSSCCFLPHALLAACCAKVATSDCVLGHPFGLNIRSHPYADLWPPLSHLSLLSFFLLTADIIVLLLPSIVIRFLYFSVFRRCFLDRPPFCFLAPGSSRWYAPQHVSRLSSSFASIVRLLAIFREVLPSIGHHLRSTILSQLSTILVCAQSLRPFQPPLRLTIALFRQQFA